MSANYDNSDTSSASSVREIISGTHHNEAEIIRASQQYINQFNPEYINGLETIPVTTEAPWDERGEILLRNWMDEAKTNSAKHKTTAYKLKKSYRALSLGVILSTGFVFLVTSLFPCTDQVAFKYLQVCISFSSLLIANIASFYDYGPKYQAHFQYEGYYMRYYIDVQEVLATDADFRPPKDKTVVEYRERMGNLVTSAPEL